MAEGKTPPPALTREDLEPLLASLGEAERDLLRDLVREGDPREAVRLVEIMHYFQGAVLE